MNPWTKAGLYLEAVAWMAIIATISCWAGLIAYRGLVYERQHAAVEAHGLSSDQVYDVQPVTESVSAKDTTPKIKLAQLNSPVFQDDGIVDPPLKIYTTNSSGVLMNLTGQWPQYDAIIFDGSGDTLYKRMCHRKACLPIADVLAFIDAHGTEDAK